MKKTLLLGCLLLMVLVPVVSSGFFNLPPLPPPEEYGNLLINRTSEKNGMKPVTFSHWIHRQEYTCRVCHFELEFNMKVNTTEITEKTNKAGLHCGAASCHDGKTVFGHEKPHCEKCHNGNRAYGKEKFAAVAARLPRSEFGNKIDWAKARNKRLIIPAHYLTLKPARDVKFTNKLLLEAEWQNVPPAFFPHKSHIKWLDCNNCHPDIFNIKKKTTKHFEMVRILKGEFCGVCHLSVAFPMDNCRACHPGIKSL
ncbi:MAG: c(7)-type cytochrome triheme domain-containing protein [Thermodesulfovibrionales bacterium]